MARRETSAPALKVRATLVRPARHRRSPGGKETSYSRGRRLSRHDLTHLEKTRPLPRPAHLEGAESTDPWQPPVRARSVTLYIDREQLEKLRHERAQMRLAKRALIVIAALDLLLLSGLILYLI